MITNRKDAIKNMLKIVGPNAFARRVKDPKPDKRFIVGYINEGAVGPMKIIPVGAGKSWDEAIAQARGVYEQAVLQSKQQLDTIASQMPEFDDTEDT